MLFIYTSYKCVSLDLQRKLCQASREITGCEWVSAKSKLHKECWSYETHLRTKLFHILVFKSKNIVIVLYMQICNLC